MRKYLFLLVCISALLLSQEIVYAETKVGGELRGDSVWTKENSPYVLTSEVSVLPGQTLTIGPGVVVNPDPRNMQYGIQVEGGTLNIVGTADERVKINKISRITAGRSKVKISFADFSMQMYLHLVESDATVTNSSFIGSNGTAIITLGSNVNILNTKISDNVSFGIYIQSDTLRPSSFSVHNSVLTGNGISAIQNLSSRLVQAENNWWGSSAGPTVSGTNKVSGAIIYVPWLKEDPNLFGTTTQCCSSVLFLPGLQASRLFLSQADMLGKGTSTNQLWEPNRNADVKKMYLSESGSSLLPVYAGNPIDSAFGLVHVYGKFMKFLDGFSAKGTIQEWRAFGYDWRKPVDQVVNDSQLRATTSESLLNTVYEMASSSKTGKIKIIAHSNGGLVAKYLVKTLNELGKANLIDSVISVAVPFLGTPEAIPDLLHGDRQAIGGGLIVKQDIARGLGLNMASAYSLLPSSVFFQKIPIATIAFASTSVQGINNGSYAKNITNSEEQFAFISDEKNVRENPDFSNTVTPAKGNTYLVDLAKSLHAALDLFEWPANIVHWTIVGWNKTTLKGIEYLEKNFCWSAIGSVSCSTGITHVASTTEMGDGTVVSGSASYKGNQTVSLDLNSISQSEDFNAKHANILESSTTQASIAALITGGLASTTLEKLSSIPAVSLGDPSITGQSVVRLSTHSPVELHVYDSQGRHTGLKDVPNNLQGDDSFIVGAYDEEIPGSRFEINETNVAGDNENYIYLSAQQFRNYSIVISGTGMGEFTFNVDKIQNGSVVSQMKYTSVPVTPLTIATATLSLAQDFVQMPNLSIDQNGDGITDIVATETTEFDPIVYLDTVKRIIADLAPGQKSKSLISKIEKIQNLIRLGKLERAQNASLQLGKIGRHFKAKDLANSDKQKIVDAIEMFISQFKI